MTCPIARSLALVAAVLSGATALLFARTAAACGGFFASDIEVAPNQKIVVVHRDGIETYVFRPHFCGTAKDFGVILPIPSTLTASPTLADNALFEQIDQLTKPQILEECRHSGGIGCGMTTAGSKGTEEPDFDAGTGINVVDRGRVGIFDYVLMQATTARSFTDWLDANGFPHDPSGTDTYEHYVTKGWYFVAFKVSADTAAPPSGMKLCGDLGPIRLSFSAESPVVPARIANVNGGTGPAPVWRLFVIAPDQKRLASAAAPSFTATLYFASSLGSDVLTGSSAVASLSRDSDRLTALDIRFERGPGIVPDDIKLESDPQVRDYRSQKTVYKNCSGCATGTAAADTLWVVAVLAVIGAARRASWRARRSAS